MLGSELDRPGSQTRRIAPRRHRSLVPQPRSPPVATSQANPLRSNNRRSRRQRRRANRPNAKMSEFDDRWSQPDRRPNPPLRHDDWGAAVRGRAHIDTRPNPVYPLRYGTYVGNRVKGNLRFLGGGGHGCPVRVRSMRMLKRSMRWCWSRSAAWSRWASRTGTNAELVEK